MSAYDCVVIGAGHNGLVAAAYLGRAGKRVCVLERRAILGGCTSTEELYPGFRLNPAAYVISLFPPAIMSELGLKEHGLVILPRNPSSFTPLPDGRSLLLGHDDAANLREIGKFSARDAENYPKYDAMLTRIAAVLEPLMLSPAPRFPPRLREIGKWWLYRRAMKQLGSQWRTAAELFTAPATRILDRYFESEPLRATIATDAIIGAMAAPSTPGSAYVLLHHVMGEAGGKRGIWAYIRGGVGGLADALEKVCLAAGVEIRRNAEVVRINVQGTQVSGVTLADGTEIAAKVVASSIDGNQTFLRLLGAGHLPDEFAEQVRCLDYSWPAPRSISPWTGYPTSTPAPRPARSPCAARPTSARTWSTSSGRSTTPSTVARAKARSWRSPWPRWSTTRWRRRASTWRRSSCNTPPTSSPKGHGTLRRARRLPTAASRSSPSTPPTSRT
jgi:phytoene dehydrogenase-like protein